MTTKRGRRFGSHENVDGEITVESVM